MWAPVAVGTWPGIAPKRNRRPPPPNDFTRRWPLADATAGLRDTLKTLAKATGSNGSLISRRIALTGLSWIEARTRPQRRGRRPWLMRETLGNARRDSGAGDARRGHGAAGVSALLMKRWGVDVPRRRACRSGGTPAGSLIGLVLRHGAIESI